MQPECPVLRSQQPPLVPILSQINLDHTSPFHFLKIHFNIILPFCLCLQNGLFFSGLTNQNPLCSRSVCHVCHMSCPSWLFCPDNIQYRIESSLLCSLLPSPSPHPTIGTLTINEDLLYCYVVLSGFVQQIFNCKNLACGGIFYSKSCLIFLILFLISAVSILMLCIMMVLL
jgi:hypothetical protein